MCDCSSSLRRNSAFKLVAEHWLLQLTVLALLSLGSYFWCLGAMALDTLRYGSFKPTYVAADTKALPGYGGEVQSWADYRFAVEALEKKEAQIAEGERKKLGPLALRLTERLVGPALQVAKKVGVEKLSQPDGVKVLLEALEKQLLPLRKQAALELYRAGMREGILSRQTGEPMSSYCLRREAWWTQLRDMDPSIQCSDAILGEQLLQHAGLGHLEQQMVRTVCQNDLSDMDRLANTLRDQFGTLHERETNRGKGKGKYEYKPWSQRTGYMTDFADDNSLEDSSQAGYNNVETYQDSYANHQEDDETYGDDDAAWEDDQREREIEEEVVIWYASQNIDAQTLCAGRLGACGRRCGG